jgi:hypothetical protein
MCLISLAVWPPDLASGSGDDMEQRWLAAPHEEESAGALLHHWQQAAWHLQLFKLQPVHDALRCGFTAWVGRRPPRSISCLSIFVIGRLCYAGLVGWQFSAVVPAVAPYLPVSAAVHSERNKPYGVLSYFSQQ